MKGVQYYKTTEQFHFRYFFGKILEKLLFTQFNNFNFNLNSNNLLDSNQSSFRPNYFCESQLLSVFHLYSSFDCYTLPEVRGIFLGISKASDRVLHERLIH